MMYKMIDESGLPPEACLQMTKQLEEMQKQQGRKVPQKSDIRAPPPPGINSAPAVSHRHMCCFPHDVRLDVSPAAETVPFSLRTADWAGRVRDDARTLSSLHSAVMLYVLAGADHAEGAGAIAAHLRQWFLQATRFGHARHEVHQGAPGGQDDRPCLARPDSCVYCTWCCHRLPAKRLPAKDLPRRFDDFFAGACLAGMHTDGAGRI